MASSSSSAALLTTTIQVWSLETGKEVKKLEGHDNHVNCVSVTPDGLFIISSSRDKTIRVWGPRDWKGDQET